jgi:hypothetical protein
VQAEVSRFAQILLRAPVVQPLVLELTRRERPWIHLKDPSCEASIRELDGLLVQPEAADLGLAPNGIPVHRTPVGCAIDCLQICVRAHPPRDAARNAIQLEERISELRTRHARACRERTECLRVSPAWSLEVLYRWVDSTKDDGGGAAAILEREAREHVARVATELLLIASATAKAHAAVEQFRRMCEGELRTAVLACALRQRADGIDSELTLWTQRSLDSQGVAAWSFAERCGPARDPAKAMSRVVVQAVSYRASPRTQIAEALRCFATCLEAAPWVLGCEAYLLVFRLGGPVCLLPSRLDFDRLTISIIFINAGEKSPEPAITVDAEDLMASAAGIGGCAHAGAKA